MTTAWSQHGLTLTWREEDKWHASLFLGKFLVGSIHRWPSGKWSVSLPIGRRGQTLGYFTTGQEARDALVGAVLEAMRDE